MNLGELLSGLAPDPAGGLSVEIPPDWLQGRTAFGGLNAALAQRAASRFVAVTDRLRAFQIAFIAPAAGTLRYVPVVLRQGRSVTFVGVDCFAADALCARAIVTYGAPRDIEVSHTRLAAPASAPPDDCPDIPLIPGVTPAFLAHMELRFAAGTPLLSGGEPAFAWWVRHRISTGVDPASALLAVGDVLPPAVVAGRTDFHPGSSITWALDVAGPLPDPDSWYLLSTSSDHAGEGYSTQAMSCFAADGTLAAVSRQTVAVF